MSSTAASVAPCALIADDQPDVLAALRLLLKLEGVETATASSPDAVLAAVRSRTFDLVVLDMNYSRDTTSGREGLDLISRVRDVDRGLPVAGMTAWGSVDVAVEAMRRGLDDFVLKPWENARLLSVLREQLAKGRERRREQRARQAHAHDLARARDFQRALVPASLPCLTHTDLGASWRQAQEVGGDYFDVVPLADTSTLVAVGDAAGKGVAAGLLMASVQTLVGELSAQALAPDVLCDRLNHVLTRRGEAAALVSLIVGRFDDRSGTFDYANAGHPPALLVRADGRHERLTDGGPVLGGLPGATYAAGRVTLAPGDRLVLVTDGITEAIDDAGEEFGGERVADVAGQSVASTAVEVCRAIEHAVKVFSGREPDDDATVVVLSRR